MNQDEFKVSVVIAHYNAGNYIRKALDSLVRQTMNQDDFEVIIVDDKSTKPLDIIQEYASQLKHLRIIIEDQNHGYPSIPRNHGIAKARGTFIMLMDQDDNLADDTLLTFVEFAGDDSDVIIGKYAEGKMYNGTQVPFKNDTNIKDASIITDHILSTLAPHKMYRRAMLNQYDVRFPDSSYIPVEEDQVFNMKAYSVSRKISILADKDYYYWNQREDFGNLGKSSSYTYNEPWKYLNILSEVFNIIEASPNWSLAQQSKLKAMYIGRLFNSSYTTVLEIIKLQKNEQERETLIAGLRKIINERMDSQSISEVRQESRWMVLGIKYGMNDEELSNLETELFSGEKSLAQNIQCINGETVKKLSIHGQICAIPVDFLKKEKTFGSN
ncbi:Glycosyltransferase EpsH [Leuconostoc gasicomitatum]|uniref:glycosyltransferase family 2 protein n=1 Tax=Leuconostoc gelidum group TaxID=3016637 RepID=UPI00027E6A35|nr:MULTISPECIES: glycosyltransferase family 2 protein [Leuconostoc gelidum group]AFS40127.1 glycosyltransferase-like protein [Leuconostoc gelidum JB7]MBZ5952066.1 glycosyltransferase family 2 protein [Leuconostoc gasicomitatum]MBZ5968233.1 glycosyltransferase family 2 protein [Leuconostoc gasicomitatum]QDJ30118.1 glycosyl transferase [Leuconostoc gelidum subsp. gelidum]SOC02221.1 Glycosyltransferase-like protein [Leuconostoc gasicomitatum]